MIYTDSFLSIDISFLTFNSLKKNNKSNKKLQIYYVIIQMIQHTHLILNFSGGGTLI